MKSNRTPQILITLLLILFSLSVLHADTSSEKEESSEKPACAVCTANGNPMKVRNLDLWSKHNGKTYYFCNEDCKAKFNQNPEAYMPPVLPRTLPKFVLEDLKGKEVIPFGLPDATILSCLNGIQSLYGFSQSVGE
ncbi:YHS domain-containing protein [Candidatus Poribacteria bacterium]|nr:YHS domain-containing protein [Candidatus Poribacteria bacterium]